MGASAEYHRHEISCSALQVDLNYLIAEFGDIQDVVGRLPYTEEHLLDENNWIDYESLLKVYDLIREKCRDNPDIMREIGRSVLVNDRSYRFVRSVSFLIWNPTAVYSRIPKFVEKTFSFITASFASQEKRACVVTYDFGDGFVPNVDLLEHTVGMMEVTASIAGYDLADVELTVEGQRATFQIRWAKKKRERFAISRKLKGYRATIGQLEENSTLLQEKYGELEAARSRIRQQLDRQMRLHELGLLTARTIDLSRLELNLLRFFQRNLKISCAMLVARSADGNFYFRWWLREGQIAIAPDDDSARRELPAPLRSMLSRSGGTRFEPRSLDLFLRVPDFYPKAAGFTVLPLLVDDRQEAFVVLPETDAAKAEEPERVQFLHSMRTEVELALARVLAVDELEKLKSNLEVLVDQRTGELNTANDELQRSFRKLMMLDRVKSDFLMNVSFELRNPLNMILSPLQLVLADSGPLSEENRGHLKTAQHNALVLLRHITHLLQLQQGDNFNVFLSYTTVSPEELLSRINEIASESGASSGIELKLTVHEDLPSIIIDREKITSALHAIVSNAFKFNRPGGSVEIRASKDDGFLRIDVRDTGIGISEAQQEVLFERFASHGDPMEKQYPGIGIGLSMASDYVDLHRGRIEVKSQAGQGATFSVFLPLGDAHVDEKIRDRRVRPTEEPALSRRAVDPERETLSKYVANRETLEYIDIVDVRRRDKETPEQKFSLIHRKTVLFVHADRTFTSIAETILLKYFNVRTAHDGRSATKIIYDTPPDIVVTAPALPEVSGIELIQRLRASNETTRIPSILLSEKIDLHSRMVGLEEGADMYMSIPLDFNALVAHIGSLTEMREMREQLELSNLSLEGRVSQLVVEREKLSLGVIEALALSIDAKDQYTHGHSARVRAFSTDFASFIGLDEQVVKQLELSSVLHDIGKIGVPEHILNKNGRLDPDEWAKVKEHPAIGASILTAIPQFQEAIEEIRGHHEYWDGSGYPDGLAGTDIPTGARIICLADSYDAMSFKRVYRDAKNHDEIVAEIDRCLGTQFDPDLGGKFLAWLAQRADSRPVS